MVRKEAPKDDAPHLQGANGSAKEISIIPLEKPDEREEKVELRGKVALIVGGATDSGRSLAEAFAERGVDVVLIYFNSAHEVAVQIKEKVEAQGQRCMLVPGETVEEDVDEQFARKAMRQIIETFGRLDIFINFSAHSFPLGRLVRAEKESDEDVRSRIFPHFNIMKAALGEIVR